jgi:hypothetical protein
MGVRKDCRHYSTRSTPTGDVLQRCRLTVNQEMPFACPDDCLFFEPRSLSNAGWQRFERADDGDLWGEGFQGEDEDDPGQGGHPSGGQAPEPGS